MSDLGTNDPSIRYDSSLQEGIGENERHSLQTYVSDLLALEEHIGKPLDAQIKSDETADFPEALGLIEEIKALNAMHAQVLRQALDRLGGHAANPIKSAWSSLLGNAAAAIGASRKTKVTKWLRDDYTALNLAAISYTLLLSTAAGLGDLTTAKLATQGLADYSRAIMHINQIIPEVVLFELAEDGESVQVGAADLIRQLTNDIWRTEAADTRA